MIVIWDGFGYMRLQGVMNVIIKVSLRLEYHVCLCRKSMHFLPLHQECHLTLNSRSILGAVRRRPVTRNVEVCAVRLVNMNTDMLNMGTNMLVLVKTRPAARASETREAMERQK